MLILVTGGSSSGKSEFAESLIVNGGSQKRFYIATMEPYDEESRRRVQKHRQARADKKFVTIECPRALLDVKIPENAAALLECMSNLVANECFGGEGFEGAVERILAGVDKLLIGCPLVVIVSNELFSDGSAYDEDDTREYMQKMAQVNRALGARADKVFELVCNIPLQWKGNVL